MRSKMESEALNQIHAAVSDYFEQLYRPGQSHLHGIVHVAENPTSSVIAFSGPVMPDGGFPVPRLALLAPGESPVLLGDAGAADMDPKWSPDGTRLAFLSDPEGGGNFKLFLAEADQLSTRRQGPQLAGEVVESFAWSPDGSRILIQTADVGADAAGSASTSRIGSAQLEKPSWMPTVDTGSHDNLWRRARIWHLSAGTLVDIGEPGWSVWEADWLGSDRDRGCAGGGRSLSAIRGSGA
jgi:dipeptidyl aminopeptidase/acylaminoacyl peptidase